MRTVLRSETTLGSGPKLESQACSTRHAEFKSRFCFWHARHHHIRVKCYPESMNQTSTRDTVLEALKTLPEDATLDQIIERLVFMAKLEEGYGSLKLER
jgi:hypothetical protein